MHRGSQSSATYGNGRSKYGVNFNCRTDAERCAAAATELGYEAEVGDARPLPGELADLVPAIIAEIAPHLADLKEHFEERDSDYFRVEIEGTVKCQRIKRGTARWTKAMTAWAAERRAAGLPLPTWLDHTVSKGYQPRSRKASVSSLHTYRDCLAAKIEDATWEVCNCEDRVTRETNCCLLAEEVVEQIVERDQPANTITVAYAAYPGQPPTKAIEIVETVKANGGNVTACQCSPDDEVKRQISACFPNSEAAERCLANLQSRGYSATISKCVVAK